ncbi:VOC family protein [Halobacillus rhizosphaerae]|uniref:VOC family protein n=1 Tax=Halobacillus rhizosphaerae TaxID=3064889 RepID=UPI00398A8393
MNNVCVFTIHVHDMDQALKFYTEVLKFETEKKYGEKIISLVHHDIPIVLEENVHMNKDGGQNVRLGLKSEDIDQDFSYLRSKGVTILVDEPQPCPPGRYIVFEDPSGNHLELVEIS